MSILFDKQNKIILIEKSQSEITIQELINAIRDFEDEWNGMDEKSLSNAYGKQDLGGGAKVGITLELINNWRIQFEDRTEWTTCYIKGGNLVAINDYDNNPIKSSAYANTIIAQSASATIAEPVISEEDKADIVADIEKGMVGDIHSKLPDTRMLSETQLTNHSSFIQNILDNIKGAEFHTDKDSLKAIKKRMDKLESDLTQPKAKF